jgi:hypothetical protein
MVGNEVDIWKGLLSTSPFAGALIFLFLRFLAWIREYQALETTRTEKVAAALEKNNELLGRVSENLLRTAQALENQKKGGG